MPTRSSTGMEPGSSRPTIRDEHAARKRRGDPPVDLIISGDEDWLKRTRKGSQRREGQQRKRGRRRE